MGIRHHDDDRVPTHSGADPCDRRNRDAVCAGADRVTAPRARVECALRVEHGAPAGVSRAAADRGSRSQRSRPGSNAGFSTTSMARLRPDIYRMRPSARPLRRPAERSDPVSARGRAVVRLDASMPESAGRPSQPVGNASVHRARERPAGKARRPRITGAWREGTPKRGRLAGRCAGVSPHRLPDPGPRRAGRSSLPGHLPRQKLPWWGYGWRVRLDVRSSFRDGLLGPQTQSPARCGLMIAIGRQLDYQLAVRRRLSQDVDLVIRGTDRFIDGRRLTRSSSRTRSPGYLHHPLIRSPRQS